MVTTYYGDKYLPIEWTKNQELWCDLVVTWNKIDTVHEFMNCCNLEPSYWSGDLSSKKPALVNKDIDIKYKCEIKQKYLMNIACS